MGQHEKAGRIQPTPSTPASMVVQIPESIMINEIVLKEDIHTYKPLLEGDQKI